MANSGNSGGSTQWFVLSQNILLLSVFAFDKNEHSIIVYTLITISLAIDVFYLVNLLIQKWHKNKKDKADK